VFIEQINDDDADDDDDDDDDNVFWQIFLPIPVEKFPDV